MSVQLKPIDFSIIEEFEHNIAKFFGSPYAIAVDSCTHGLELCLRLTGASKINVPKHTYLSVPMLSYKLNIGLEWRDEIWEDYYTLNYDDRRIIDAAVLWKEGSYIPNTFMCISFQYQKHLSLGRGGIILTDNKEDAIRLKMMSYDGRLPNIPWRDQVIDTIGYHYYMTPETAQNGLSKLAEAINNKPKKWKYEDWPDLTKMPVFIDPYLQTK